MNPEELQEELKILKTANDTLLFDTKKLDFRVTELEAYQISAVTSNLIVKDIEAAIFQHIFIGSVSSNGQIFLDFPSGWTSTRTGTGKYEIAHTLGTTAFSITLGCTTTTGNPRILNVITISNSRIQLETADDAGALADAAYFFTIILP